MEENVITGACFELILSTRQRLATSLHMEQNVQIFERRAIQQEWQGMCLENASEMSVENASDLYHRSHHYPRFP